ncbi:high-affinity choline transporter 1-like isoform X1 [Hydractinia symbiolongicarpus]|uniref:high-affinity choline transporter 1-like isoform X1 n=1 Tax=Hydractinia symbiolongicarpus TaxID=13093 RepID=UPI0025511DF7|nr:high-affinity choline transporter 1-like isoform X1 [Hydractinia symbiolongicarpus]XP_057317218.1 high-affinity choline transporter 1-like isoform X1 [Hydractinia symbiolongicarpus]
MTDVNVAGLISIIIFYLAILGVGIFAARKKNKKPKRDGSVEQQTNEVILAGRDIGAVIGCFTMTATWVGGGYINGTAESVYKSGLVWAQAPWGYATSLAIGGLLFAKPMREAKYVTMLDPLQHKYGKVMGAFLYIPAFLGESFWSASILSALGATLAVILHLDMNLSVVISTCIAVGYTFFGGLYSVAYTDVLQLICIGIGLWLTVPFTLTRSFVAPITETRDLWLGSVSGAEWGLWIDYAALLICGGIPWQVYFQRVLSSKSPRRAQILSFVGAFGCFLMAIPAVLIGAGAKSMDWTNMTEPSSNLVENGTIKDTRLVLPMVLQYATPGWVSFIGLGAVSAAVMSSADSSVLSASSMFGHNIYKLIFRPKASAKEIIWVIRIGIVVVGFIATCVGLTVKSIYDLFRLCSDLVFVILFPQLVGAVHIPFVNTYGSICAYVIGLLLRVSGGEELIGLPPLFKFPYYQNGRQYFPFRILAMSMSFATLLSVSYLTNYLFDNGYISEERDFLKVLKRRDKGRQQGKDILLTEKYTKKTGADNEKDGKGLLA